MSLQFARACALMGALAVAAVAPAWGETESVRAPERIDGATRVDAEDMVALAGETSDLVVIDARIAMDRKQGYIQGSISLPDVDTSCATLARILPAKSTPVLFYCNGVKCGRSVNSTRKALACGYRKVYWFRGGFEEWKTKGYPYLKE